MVVVLCVGSPLVFVAVQASGADWAPARALFARPLVGRLVWHTVALASAVTTATVALEFGAAYLVERTDLPLRRFFAVALVLPLAVPEFVQGFVWASLTSGVRGYWGTVLVMSVSLYPLVFLPVSASLRRSDPAVEEVSHSLGHGRWVTLCRVTIPLTRPAIGGGALLARSLGAGPWQVLLRVTLPLVLPGLGVAAALVTLSASTELTATLLLRPIGTDTLATQFWTCTSELSYGAAAPYAAAMIGISVLPVLLLTRHGAL